MTEQRTVSLVPRRTADVVPSGGAFDFRRCQPGDTIVITYGQMCAMGPEAAEALPQSIITAAHRVGLGVAMTLDHAAGEYRVNFTEARDGQKA